MQRARPTEESLISTTAAATKQLTLLDHLRELRRRLVFSAIAVVVALVPGWYLTEYVLLYLKSRAPGVELIYTSAQEMLATYIKVSLYIGVAIALPFVALQAILYVAPALTRRERTFLYALLPAVLFFFLSGVSFSFYVVLPPALKFLLSFGNDIARPLIGVDNYISLVSRLLFWSGVVFEIPIVMYFLAKIGVVSARSLSRYRKWAIVGAFILGAFITPTADPVNQTLMALPIIILYEIGLLLAKLARRGLKPATA